MNKIAIIIPTIHRDEILMETINSILDNYQDNWVILIGDQNKEEDWSFEKSSFYHSACAEAHTALRNQDRIKVHHLPYDCGLSHARNELVKLANNLDIKYCLIGADSIKFTESMKSINYLIKYLNYSPDFNIDLLGLEVQERISWEAWLDLQDSFILDFIEKNPIEGLLDRYCKNNITIWNCDIVRNFFLATTKSLLEVKWDNNLKMMEHEDFFWRYKQTGYKVGWTNYSSGKYSPGIDIEYKKIRAKNMNISKEELKQKYNLKSWVQYINLKNAKR